MLDSDIKLKLEQHHQDCYGWALHCCGQDHEMAKEVLQNSYLKILERKHTFLSKSEFRTWAFAIIKNTAKDAIRKLKREKLVLRVAEQMPDRGFEAAFDLVADQAYKEAFFEEALNQLSERQRQILQLVFYHDLSLNQSADVLQISQGAVRKYYDRAKKDLVVWFQKKGMVEFLNRE